MADRRDFSGRGEGAQAGHVPEQSRREADDIDNHRPVQLFG